MEYARAKNDAPVRKTQASLFTQHVDEDVDGGDDDICVGEALRGEDEGKKYQQHARGRCA